MFTRNKILALGLMMSLTTLSSFAEMSKQSIALINAKNQLVSINAIAAKHFRNKTTFSKSEQKILLGKIDALKNTWLNQAPSTLKLLRSKEAQMLKNQFIKGDVSTWMNKKFLSLSSAVINQKPSTLTQTTFELSESADQLLTLTQ